MYISSSARKATQGPADEASFTIAEWYWIQTLQDIQHLVFFMDPGTSFWGTPMQNPAVLSDLSKGV